MESLKGTESLFMIILSLISQIIDIPNYSELVGGQDKKKNSGSDEQGSPDNSSLVRRNVFFDMTAAAKTLFQSNGDTSTGDSEVIFGRPLPLEIPTKLKKLLIFLKQSVHWEGIFRKCGSSKRIKDIKKLLDSHGNVIDWNDQEVFTVHDAASVLKLYVAELPEPLLCAKHIPIHVEIAKLSEHDEKKLKCLQYVLLLLPEQNRMFLKMLLMLLSDVAKNPNSLMDSHNLGLIFAPHILKSNQLETATNMCMGANTMSDQLDDLVTYTAYLIDNSDALFQVPRDLEMTAGKYQARLERGESCEDIPVEIVSNCANKMSGDLHKNVVNDETKKHLIELYKSFQQMPEGKEKASRLKKFEKEYPHYIMELNNLSHSPMIRTKTTRRNPINSLSKLLHVKTSSTPKATSSPAPSVSSASSSFSFYKNPLQNCNVTNPHNFTEPNTMCTPSKSDVSVNVGQKRKVLEMLQSSPPRYTSLSSFIGKVFRKPLAMEELENEDVTDHVVTPFTHPSNDENTFHDKNTTHDTFTIIQNPIAMDTDPESEPRVQRRRLEEHLHDNNSHHSDDKVMTTEGGDSEEDIRMDYREIGESYREYFV